MSLFLPFNNRPDSVVAITGSYTIPVGFYARVQYNISVNTHLSGMSATTNLNLYLDNNDLTSLKYDHSTQSNNASDAIWLNTGDTINFTQSVPTSTNTLLLDNNDQLKTLASSDQLQSYVAITVNGNQFSRCKASGSTSITLLTNSYVYTNDRSFSITLSSSTFNSAVVELYAIP